MGSLRIVPVFLLLTSAAFAQTYGVGRAPTAAERAQDITISPTGAGLPAGHGTAAEGKVLFTQKNCVGCHSTGGIGPLGSFGPGWLRSSISLQPPQPGIKPTPTSTRPI